MPNRIIKESICTSDNIDQLTPFQEIVFYRLMVNCDDFGRFDARTKLLCSRLFPLRDIDPYEMEKALEALCDADLITLYVVKGRRYLQMNTWARHQQKRSDNSKYPDPADSDSNEKESDDINCNQLISDDINCDQTISDDSKIHRNRNRNRNTIIDNRNRDRDAREEDDDELIAISEEQNRVLDAAENAGFQRSNTVRAKLIDLFSVYGVEKMLAGIESCVTHGATNLAYLKACLSGDGKKKEGKSDARSVIGADGKVSSAYSFLDDRLQVPDVPGRGVG